MSEPFDSCKEFLSYRHIHSQSRIQCRYRLESGDGQAVSSAHKSNEDSEWQDLWGEMAWNLNRPAHVGLFLVSDNIFLEQMFGGWRRMLGKWLGKVQMIALTHRVDTIRNTLRLPCSRESNEFCINKHCRPTSPLPPAARKTSGKATVDWLDQKLPGIMNAK